jgi:hypothetical protein
MEKQNSRSNVVCDDEEGEFNENGDDSLLDNDSKRKRRSKNDQDGRKFQCDCGKSYLSQPALTNHKKTKHENSHCSTKRGRGRPRKNPCLSSNNKDNNEARMENFFTDERRRSKENERYKMQDVAQSVFVDVYINHKSFLDNKLERMDESKFFKLVLSSEKSDENNNAGKNKTCDTIFVEYLDYLTHYTNKEFFAFAFKFMVLFRECINKYKNVELVNRKVILNEEIPDDVTDYTQQYNADQVPDLCNEFITDFMENAEFFGMNSEEERTELIDVIQHFCHWLFKKSYTSSKLTLLG